MDRLTIKLGVISLLLASGNLVSAECIGLVPAGIGGFWDDVVAGASQASKELDIQVYARAPYHEAEIEGQQKIINFMIQTKGCKGLVLAPNAKDRAKTVAHLKTQGIPTVYIDRDIGGDRVSVIKTNNKLAGERLGREMVKALKGKGKVAMLRLKKGVRTTDIRENAFIEVAISGGLEIIIDEYLGTEIGAARGRASQILKELTAEDIDGIVTPNDVTSVGVIMALKDLKKEETFTHIGFDAHPVMVESLKSNELYGLVAQQPFQMGYKGVHTVYKAMQGERVIEQIVTDYVFVNRDNINNTKTQAILGLN